MRSRENCGKTKHLLMTVTSRRDVGDGGPWSECTIIIYYDDYATRPISKNPKLLTTSTALSMSLLDAEVWPPTYILYAYNMCCMFRAKLYHLYSWSLPSFFGFTNDIVWLLITFTCDTARRRPSGIYWNTDPRIITFY